MIETTIGSRSFQPAFPLVPDFDQQRLRPERFESDPIDAELWQPVLWETVMKFRWDRCAEAVPLRNHATVITRKLDEPAAPRRQSRTGSLAERRPVPRIGFLKGAIRVPDDFDTMGQDEIQAMFEG